MARRTETHLLLSEDGLVVRDRSGGVTAGNVISEHAADHAGHTLCCRGVYRAETHTWVRRDRCVLYGCVSVCCVLQDLSVRFAAGDERQVELVFVQRHVIAVNCFARRLLQSRQVHHGTAHRIVLAPPLWHRLEDTCDVKTGNVTLLTS